MLFRSLSIDPEFVDASFLYIKPTIAVRYNSRATTLSAVAVQTKVTNAIINFENTKLGTFDSNRFRYSQFIQSIDAADSSIVSNLTLITIERRFVPSLTTSSTYNINFNNALNHPHAGHKYIISSSAFTYQNQTCYFDDDGNGNLRIYYLLNSTRVYLNQTAGLVNYISGLVTVSSFLPTAFVGSALSIFADPTNNDVNAVRNQILLIAGATVSIVDDTTTIVAANTVTATTTGVTTQNSGSSISPSVY